jgi:hypothetical protein
VLFLQKEGIDLYQVLIISETSREALRFYHPRQAPGGISITMASLGSALSLVSDLRWYVKRYMRGVLFEVSEGVYCTHPLAKEVYYDRSVILTAPWKYRFRYIIRDNAVVDTEYLSPGEGCVIPVSGNEMFLEVWCTPAEVAEVSG